jgi:hypothetical protein
MNYEDFDPDDYRRYKKTGNKQCYFSSPKDEEIAEQPVIRLDYLLVVLFIIMVLLCILIYLKG